MGPLSRGFGRGSRAVAFFCLRGPCISGRESNDKQTRNAIHATQDVALEPDVKTMFLTNICIKIDTVFYLQKNFINFII